MRRWKHFYLVEELVDSQYDASAKIGRRSFRAHTGHHIPSPTETVRTNDVRVRAGSAHYLTPTKEFRRTNEGVCTKKKIYRYTV